MTKFFLVGCYAILDRTCWAWCTVPADGDRQITFAVSRRLSSILRPTEPVKDKPKRKIFVRGRKKQQPFSFFLSPYLHSCKRLKCWHFVPPLVACKGECPLQSSRKKNSKHRHLSDKCHRPVKTGLCLLGENPLRPRKKGGQITDRPCITCSYSQRLLRFRQSLLVRSQSLLPTQQQLASCACVNV